jgi:hypothetical protein
VVSTGMEREWQSRGIGVLRPLGQFPGCDSHLAAVLEHDLTLGMYLGCHCETYPPLGYMTSPTKREGKRNGDNDSIWGFWVKDAQEFVGLFHIFL